MTIPEVIAVGSTVTAGVLALTFTESDPLLIIAALSALVLTAGGVIVNIIVAWRTSAKVDVANAKVDDNTRMTQETAKATAEVKAQANVIEGQVNVIEGHVNSAAAHNTATCAAQEKQIAMLRETIAKMEQIAALRDQAQAIHAAHVPVTPKAAIPISAPDSLDNIDKNTKAIEKNTASTDAKVDDLKGGT